MRILSISGYLSRKDMQFAEAFHTTKRVEGFTHNFYRYPARFSPSFVRFVLDYYTKPGDFVLDPFMGGGTTIVEAAASGRRAIGSDINELAQFVAKAKTTPLSPQDVCEVRDWVRQVSSRDYGAMAYCPQKESPIRNMPIQLFPFFDGATRLAGKLQFSRRRQFARCALIGVGQWALDARKSIPSSTKLADQLQLTVEKMLGGLDAFVGTARSRGIYKNKITSTRQIFRLSASNGLLAYQLRRRQIRPKLVLTSPPYPGVHVLYHRWQVQGRRETPAPYWLSELRDGHGESFYTMGGRSTMGVKAYFAKLEAAFRNIRSIVADDSRIVQLVSFRDPVVQLPKYLATMAEAGFEEISDGPIESGLVRSVPNRRWYSHQIPDNAASKEVLLVHRPAN